MSWELPVAQWLKKPTSDGDIVSIPWAVICHNDFFLARNVNLNVFLRVHDFPFFIASKAGMGVLLSRNVICN